jgi:hypothetical protein
VAESFVRRAGRAALVDGSVLLWSIAEGRRGARWRALTTRDGALTADLLLEVGVDGRPARLEIAASDGLLTLHPEPDGVTAHGNVVGVAGVRPLAFDWSPGHWFEARLNPVVSAAMCRALRADLGVGEFRVVPGLHVDDRLQVWRGVRGVTRLTETRFLIEEADESGWELSLDNDGLPIFEAGDRRRPDSAAAPVWPLEVDSPA